MYAVRITRLVLCAAFCLLLFPLFALAADDPVSKFEKLIGDATTATNASSMVYLNKYQQAWAKRRFAVADVKFDVKKTDSLVNPIVGLVTYLLATEQSHFTPTKEEAQTSTAFDPQLSSTLRIALTYSYKDTKWVFSKGSYEKLSGAQKGRNFEMLEDEIKSEPTANPFAAVLFWIPK
jgi:hypothetical protein